MQFSMILVALFATAMAVPVAQPNSCDVVANKQAGQPATEQDESAATSGAAAAQNTGAAAAAGAQDKAAGGKKKGGNQGGNAAGGAAAQGGAQGGNGPVTADLVPDFGVKQGTNPDGTGNCDGINGKKIPCFCPPDKGAFTQKLGQFVQQGNIFGTPATFPTDNSAASQKARLSTALIALQSFNGTKGVGCPAVSTTYQAQIAKLG